MQHPQGVNYRQTLYLIALNIVDTSKGQTGQQHELFTHHGIFHNKNGYKIS